MRLGLQVVRFDWPGGPENTGPKLAEIGRAAEAAGFYSLWVMDHYYQIAPGLGSPDSPMLEGYSALHFLAGHTSRVKLGTLVSGVIYREPAFLVKQASTLDVLSGGRAYFGIGAAWYEAEAVGMGFPFPPVKERFERLEETLQMVAQYGDGCNLFTRAGNEELARKLEVLRRHCDEVGRDYDEIEKTSLSTIRLAPGEMTSGDLIEFCRGLADLGFQQAIFNLPNVHEIAPIELIGQEVLPEVSGL